MSSTVEVEKLLNKMNSGKSPDQVQPRVLKECPKQLVIPITIIFKGPPAGRKLMLHQY